MTPDPSNVEPGSRVEGPSEPVPATGRCSEAPGSAVTLRVEHDPLEGWRVIYRHRNVAEMLPGGGCCISIVPDDSGPHVTTVARCSTEASAKGIVAALTTSPFTEAAKAVLRAWDDGANYRHMAPAIAALRKHCPPNMAMRHARESSGGDSALEG